MEFKDILAISGFHGLYRFVAQGKNGIIVESFDNGKRMHVGAQTKVSSMDDIAVFTGDGEARLVDVLKSISEIENGGPCADPKSDKDEHFEYFRKVLPGFDETRVYHSDIKKILQWYNILRENDLLKFEEEKDREKEDKEHSPSEKQQAAASAKPARTQKKTSAVRARKETGPAGAAQKRTPTSTKNK